MSLFDPFNNEEIKNLKDHVFNPKWGIWHRIDNLEKNAIPDIHDKFNHAEWGVWKRLVHLENENARLRKRVDKLEKLADNLEKLLIKAVNKQLGEKK